MLDHHVPEDVLDSFVEFGAEGDRLLDLGGHVVEAVGHDRVEHDQRTRDRLRGPDRPKLEAVAREGERVGAVSVARVLGQLRQRVGADPQGAVHLGR